MPTYTRKGAPHWASKPFHGVFPERNEWQTRPSQRELWIESRSGNFNYHLDAHGGHIEQGKQFAIANQIDEADKLMAEMKKATTLKEGVKIGAACMQVKMKVTALAQALDAAVKFLDEAQAAMKDMGLECNDETILQKIAKADVKTILTEGGGLLEKCKSVYDLVDAIAG